MTPEQFVDGPFGAVADAFRGTLSADEKSGAALSVWIDGKPAVHLWGGIAHASARLPYQATTLNRMYSCTKGIASVLVGRLVEQGRLPSLETPVAEVWPEFAAEGSTSSQSEMRSRTEPDCRPSGRTSRVRMRWTTDG